MSLTSAIEFIKNLIQTLGYFGIFIGTFIESFIAPIPSEPLLAFAGFLISEGKFTWFGVIFSAVLGNLTASALIWWLGNKYGENFILKYGKYIGYTKADLLKSESLFAKYGYFIVFACQLLPLMRSLISIPAGVLKTKLAPFLLATGLGAGIWLTILTSIGYSLGRNWESISDYLKPWERPLQIIVVALVALLILRQLIIILKRRSNKVAEVDEL